MISTANRFYTVNVEIGGPIEGGFFVAKATAPRLQERMILRLFRRLWCRFMHLKAVVLVHRTLGEVRVCLDCREARVVRSNP